MFPLHRAYELHVIVAKQQSTKYNTTSMPDYDLLIFSSTCTLPLRSRRMNRGYPSGSLPTSPSVCRPPLPAYRCWKVDLPRRSGQNQQSST